MLRIPSNNKRHRLVYIDASGIEAGIVQDRGWGLRGKKLSAKKSGKYYKRTNIILGLVNNKPIAPDVFNGSCDTKLGISLICHKKRVIFY